MKLVLHLAALLFFLHITVKAGTLEIINDAFGVIEDGSGIVTSAPTGVNCQVFAGPGFTACDFSFPNNSQAELTATPAPGSQFTGWGGDCSSTELQNPITITVGPDTSIRVCP